MIEKFIENVYTRCVFRIIEMITCLHIIANAIHHW